MDENRRPVEESAAAGDPLPDDRVLSTGPTKGTTTGRDMVEESSNTSMTRRAMKGIGWTAIGAGGHSLLHLTILAILARLLTPEDFGLVAVALIVVNLAGILSESGIGQAIVQRRTLEPIHLRVGLTVTIVLALGLWLLIASLSGLVERAFSIDGVAPIVAVVSFSIVIRAFTLGDYVLFRELAFRRVAIVELTGYGIGYGVVAIVAALQGAGAWAIVMGHLGYALVRTILLWILAPHPARPAFRRDVARDLLSYGGGHTLGRLANWFGREGDNLVVGRFLGAATLGLYGRAYQLMVMPAKLFGQVADRVLFSSIAKIQEDPVRVGRAYRRGVAVIALMALPATALMAVLADEVILVFLGDDWLGLRAAFDVLVFGILFRTSYKLSDALAIATGAVYRHAWRQGVYAAAIMLGAMVGQFWGLTGVAIGVTTGIIINFLLMAQLSLDLTDVTWREFMKAHVPGLVAAVVTAAGAIPAAVGLRAVDGPALVVLIGASASAAVAMLVFLRVTSPLSLPMGPAALLRELRGGLGPRVTNTFDKFLPPPRAHASSAPDSSPSSRSASPLDSATRRRA